MDVHRNLIESLLTAFDARHLQHVVDEGEEEAVGRLKFIEVLQNGFGVVDVLADDIREANDGIHRRTDIMAHAEEEIGLGFVGRFGRSTRLFCFTPSSIGHVS